MFFQLASCVLLCHLTILLVKHWSIARVKRIKLWLSIYHSDICPFLMVITCVPWVPNTIHNIFFSTLLQLYSGKRLSVQEEIRSYLGSLISSFHEVAVIARSTVCKRDHENSLTERDSSLAPTWNLTKLYIYIYIYIAGTRMMYMIVSGETIYWEWIQSRASRSAPRLQWMYRVRGIWYRS
jgi:hypothetical protein